MCPNGLPMCVFETGLAIIALVFIAVFVGAGLGFFDITEDENKRRKP